MTLQGIGVTQPAGMRSFRLRLKFGRYAYFAIELKKGEDAKSIAKNSVKLAEQVARLK